MARCRGALGQPRLVPAPCARRSAFPNGRPHWHSAANQPPWGPITLPQSEQCLRSDGSGGLGMHALRHLTVRPWSPDGMLYGRGKAATA